MAGTAAPKENAGSVSRNVKKRPGGRAEARPSSSVILVSPSFEILLLHRVQTSSSFPSAHVFPGGTIDKHDGLIPEKGVERHQDHQAYRVGALRELFEESGILLAREGANTEQLVSISQTAREEGRKLVHSGKIPFQSWLNQQSANAILDTVSLIPFSHWITPPNIPRRFTTQMYIYFLPSQEDSNPPPFTSNPTTQSPSSSQLPADFIPTPDGNLENTAATFSPAHVWLSRAHSGSIILFPPQFLLLHLISLFLDQDDSLPPSRRIEQLKDFIYTNNGNGETSWAHKCISPYALPLPFPRADGKTALGLDKPGVEVAELGLEGKTLGLMGSRERVVLVRWSKEGPRDLEVRWRREVVEESRRKYGDGVKL